jgi:hypothetical protein
VVEEPPLQAHPPLERQAQQRQPPERLLLMPEALQEDVEPMLVLRRLRLRRHRP